MKCRFEPAPDLVLLKQEIQTAKDRKIKKGRCCSSDIMMLFVKCFFGIQIVGNDFVPLLAQKSLPNWSLQEALLG
jgi:hypothetical protein